MDTFEDIKEPLERALEIICKDKSKLRVSNPKKVITAEFLEQAAGNHLFDDDYEKLGITEDEGHKIRVYFQSTAHTNGEEYVSKLHKAFPNILNREESRFLKRINKIRIEEGFKSINF